MTTSPLDMILELEDEWISTLSIEDIEKLCYLASLENAIIYEQSKTNAKNFSNRGNLC